MSDPLPELQALVRAARARHPHADYPPALRCQVLAWAGARFREGWSQDRIVSALGMPASTFSRWKDAGTPRPSSASSAAVDTPTPPPAGPPPTFRAVELLPSERPAAASRPVARTWALHSPRGYRVDGLDLDDLTALLGRLG